jgi:hypothetical protein
MVKEDKTYRSKVDIEGAFEDMYEGSLFTFNGRKQPLEVIVREDEDAGPEAPQYDGHIVARIPGRENASNHEFFWGYNYNGVKHKPRLDQTNNVKQVTVHDAEFH